VIPPELYARFSMDGAIEVTSRWVDGTVPSNWPLIYTDEEIDAYLKTIRASLEDSAGRRQELVHLLNQARIYGRTRLPLLLEGWEWVDSFGFDEGLFDADGSAQPVYVLRNV
jgi:hypothetical protein